jgi:hypothetical protein
MDWTDFVFPVKHVLQDLAERGAKTNETGVRGFHPANQDIAKMAQEDANNKVPQRQVGAPQPTMEQLKGMGGAAKSCPTCGSPMSK